LGNGGKDILTALQASTYASLYLCERWLVMDKCVICVPGTAADGAAAITTAILRSEGIFPKPKKRRDVLRFLGRTESCWSPPALIRVAWISISTDDVGVHRVLSVLPL